MSGQAVVVVGVAPAGATPSLVQRRQALGKNNSPRKRTYRPCPRLPGRRIRLQSLVTGKTCLMKCKSWSCVACGVWLKDRFIKVASAEAKRVFGAHARFMTLTLGPDARHLTAREKFRLMSDIWGRMVKRISRRPTHTRKDGTEVRRKLNAIWVRELHKDGTPHLHVLIDRFLPQSWISQNWVQCGGGKIADIRRVNIANVVAYVTKYLSKGLGKRQDNTASDGLKGIRRYGTTGTAKLKGIYPVKKGTDPWAIFFKPGLKEKREWEQVGRYEVGLVMAWVMTNFGENHIDHKIRARVESSMRDRHLRLKAGSAVQAPLGEEEYDLERGRELAKAIWGIRHE